MGEMNDFINAQTNNAQVSLEEQPRHPPDDDEAKQADEDAKEEERFAKWCDEHLGLNIRDPITVGHRHDTLLTGYDGALTYWGDEDKAFEYSMKYITPRCDPPLSGDRVDENGIPLEWRDAVKYWRETISKDPDYVPHDEYVKSIEAQKDEAKISAIVTKLQKQKNGKTFSKLYEQGKIEPYANKGKALEALAQMIAFRTGPDADTIDLVIRSSALYDSDEWTDAYRDKIISAGIKDCQGEFHRETQEHPPFIRFNDVTGAPYVDAALLAGYVREHLTYVFVRDNGRQGVLKYVYEPSGVYRLYSDDMFKGRIKQFVSDYDESLVSMRTISETFQNLNTDLTYVPHDSLDADESIINFQNGLLRISADSLELIDHTPDVLSTIQIPCNWTGEQVETPEFDKYMKTLTNNDPDITFLLLQVIGAIISNIKCWRMKRALFTKGPSDTGKSVLKRLVEMILGKGNFIGIDLAEIEARFGTGAIYGTRLAGSSDMSFLTIDELKVFKQITGGDSLFAEFKGQHPFEYTYPGLLWFCMNRLPKFGGDNAHGVFERIMVIDCPNVIPPEKQDKELADKLYAEREGIVYKAIISLQTLLAMGYQFAEPQSVLDARADYERMNNSVLAFFHECMQERENEIIEEQCTTGVIYRVYQAWTKDNNRGYYVTANEFRDALSDYLGMPYSKLTVHREHGTYFIKYELTRECKRLYQSAYGAATNYGLDYGF